MADQKSTTRLRIAQVFLLFDRLVRRALKAVEAVHFGTWLGLLDRETLRLVTDLGYRRLSEYESDTYNLSGLMPWEAKVVEEFFGPCRTLLVGAAGGGREVVALIQRGFRVAAFEPSPVFAESCRGLLGRQGLEAEVLVSEPDRVPEAMGLFDGLIVGWGAYIHIQGRDARIAFLEQFRRHAQPGSPLLVSFYVRGDQARQLQWICAIGRFWRVLRMAKHSVEFGDSFNGSFVHHFSEAEIRSELEAAGFEVGHYSEKHYGHAVGIAR